ncbi:S1 family peptidase [Streptomyces sp.]
MSHARRYAHRVVQLAGVGGIVCGALMTTQAIANPTAAPGNEVRSASGAGGAGRLAASLVSELGGSRTAGGWVGSDGQAVVAVTDAGTAAEVRRAGATAKVVKYSMRELSAATEALRAAPRVAGTAWSVDPVSNKVVVLADSTVSAGDWSRMSGVAKEMGGEVRMERTPEAFTTRSAGAEAIFSQEARCSAGFNVTDGSTGFVLTAGHCGPANTAWFRDDRGATAIGATTTSDFPGSDFSLVRYRDDAVDKSDLVNIGGGKAVRITGAADPVVGQQVFRSGSTTGLHSGQVTALDATVNYPEGTVTGLVQTTVCAEAGDSGGPLFAGSLALGITSGGSGDCTNGGVTFFQPVTKALAALGVRLTGDTGGTAASSAAATAAPAASQGSAAAVPQAPTAVATQSGATGGAAGAATGGGTGGVTTAGGPIDLRAAGPGLLTAVVGLGAVLATRWSRPGQGRRRQRVRGLPPIERWDPNGPSPLPPFDTSGGYPGG